MMWFLFANLLFVTASNPIKVGDCLTVSQLQSQSGVMDPDIYLTETCGVSHPLKGSLTDLVLCEDGMTLDLGETAYWSRTVLEHGRPGLYFPRPVPCFSSVTSAHYEGALLDLKPNQDRCDPDAYYISKYQTEHLATKEFKIFQGKAYLPYPMKIQTENYVWDDSLQEGRKLDCRETLIFVDYLGFANFQIRRSSGFCNSPKALVCETFDTSIGETEKGETCLKVQKLKTVNNCEPVKAFVSKNTP